MEIFIDEWGWQGHSYPLRGANVNECNRRLRKRARKIGNFASVAPRRTLLDELRSATRAMPMRTD